MNKLLAIGAKKYAFGPEINAQLLFYTALKCVLITFAAKVDFNK